MSRSQRVSSNLLIVGIVAAALWSFPLPGFRHSHIGGSSGHTHSGSFEQGDDPGVHSSHPSHLHTHSHSHAHAHEHQHSHEDGHADSHSHDKHENGHWHSHEPARGDSHQGGQPQPAVPHIHVVFLSFELTLPDFIGGPAVLAGLPDRSQPPQNTSRRTSAESEPNGGAQVVELRIPGGLSVLVQLLMGYDSLIFRHVDAPQFEMRPLRGQLFSSWLIGRDRPAPPYLLRDPPEVHPGEIPSPRGTSWHRQGNFSPAA